MLFVLAACAETVAAFALGWAAARLATRGAWLRAGLVGLALVAALPWLLFAAYFLHVLDVVWYFEWRAQRWSDWTPPLLGLSWGIACRLRATTASSRMRSSGRALVPHVVMAALLVAGAHAKPHLTELPLGRIHDTWDHEVCLQSTEASCGACAAATILRSLDLRTTESQMARESHTSRTGTFNWLLARALRRRGLAVRFARPASLEDTRPPAILGVRVGGVGHFVAYLGKSGGRYRLGDPLVGPEALTAEEIGRRYRFDHFALEIAPRR